MFKIFLIEKSILIKFIKLLAYFMLLILIYRINDNIISDQMQIILKFSR